MEEVLISSLMTNFVNLLKQSVRGSDRLYRYREASIFILLPETDLESAKLLADRLVNGLNNLAIPHRKCPIGVVTSSAGVASEEPSKYKDVDWQQHLERAEEALTTAKEMGRNQSATSIGDDVVYSDIATSYKPQATSNQ